MTEPRKLQDRVSIAFGSATSARTDSGAGSLATIHDALGDITLCRDLEGIILSANRTFREVTGIDDPLGRTCAPRSRASSCAAEATVLREAP